MLYLVSFKEAGGGARSIQGRNRSQEIAGELSDQQVSVVTGHGVFRCCR